jgi:hypothetical protein
MDIGRYDSWYGNLDFSINHPHMTKFLKHNSHQLYIPTVYANFENCEEFIFWCSGKIYCIFQTVLRIISPSPKSSNDMYSIVYLFFSNTFSFIPWLACTLLASWSMEWMAVSVIVPVQ